MFQLDMDVPVGYGYPSWMNCTFPKPCKFTFQQAGAFFKVVETILPRAVGVMLVYKKSAKKCAGFSEH